MSTPDPTPEAMKQFLHAATAATELWEVSERHAIIESDPITGSEQVIGPFADAYRAVIAAQKLVERAPQDHDEPYPTFRVVQYFTPEASGLTKEGETTHFLVQAGKGGLQRQICIYCKVNVLDLGPDAPSEACPEGNAR